MLRLMFGKVEDSVMHACITYLRISAYSYPALAVYNAGAALFRSIGKTSVTMYLSVISNIINVIGNFIGVFVLRAGVAGVAYPSLIARTFSAVMITVLCFQRKNEVFYRCKWIFRWNVDFMKQILKIAIPNGMENGVFQLVKVALSGIVALFGTYQIAANGVAQNPVPLNFARIIDIFLPKIHPNNAPSKSIRHLSSPVLLLIINLLIISHFL